MTSDGPASPAPGARRRGRPPNDPGQTREKLLEAAASVFNSVGYFDTNSNKIARAAGFAPATFYRYFKDKRAIFLAAYARWVGSNWAVIEKAGRVEEDAEVNAARIARALIEHHRKWGEFRRNLYALAATDASTRSFIAAERARQMDRLMDRVAGSAAALDRGAVLYSFLAIERAINAIVDGDVAALDIDEAAFVARVIEEIYYLENGRRLNA